MSHREGFTPPYIPPHGLGTAPLECVGPPFFAFQPIFYRTFFQSTLSSLSNTLWDRFLTNFGSIFGDFLTSKPCSNHVCKRSMLYIRKVWFRTPLTAFWRIFTFAQASKFNKNHFKIALETKSLSMLLLESLYDRFWSRLGPILDRFGRPKPLQILEK